MKYLIFTILLLGQHCKAKKKKFAVIGGGIGGASVAYFLRQEFPNAEISTFEQSLQLGGRLATVKVGGRYYETGGSIIHSANQYMTNFLDICKLKKKQSAQDAPFSLHRDGEVIFQVIKYIILVWLVLIDFDSLPGVGLSSDRQGKDGTKIRD